MQMENFLHQLMQLLLYSKKNRRFLANKGIFSGGALDLNTLYISFSSHTTFVGLLYFERDKSEEVCTGYKI